MKVLILSCNTGEGHNSSARALKKEMDARGIESDVADTLALVSEFVSRSMSDLYVFSTKSNLIEHFYKIGGIVSDNPMIPGLKSPVYATNRLYARKLYDHIVNGGYDAVICVHLYPAEALTALKRRARLSIPSIFVMTDYTCIPFLSETELDKYVIPHEDLIEEFAEKGIPREKIVPAGIPVDTGRLLERRTRDEARKNLSGELGWDDTSGNWYLIMSGSMGFGNLGDLIDGILREDPDEGRIVCICGRNDKLCAQLREEFSGTGEVKVLGFTDRIPEYMDACDVVLSKPGGITSTESAIKNIPLVHTNPIRGLEDYNALFFHYHGMSYSSCDTARQAEVAHRLCTDTAFRTRMTEAQKRNSKPDACAEIIGLLF